MKIDRQTPATEVLREFGRRLVILRREQRWSQQQLAEAAGVGVATLRRIEDGKDARLGSWVRLLMALRLDAAVEQLLPENLRSPLVEVKGRRRPRTSPRAPDRGFAWGDERR
ncbi:MAG: helix-turn-helix domain-containing protein [Planctomycetes bacterium]|nr:helix-turn-helix domain-containing protein [Planctomycetota bacterium]